MKSNKLMKFLLSLFIALTITCTSADIASAATTNDYNSEVSLLGEEPEKSPFDGWKKQ